jgi:hypothetical protein
VTVGLSTTLRAAFYVQSIMTGPTNGEILLVFNQRISLFSPTPSTRQNIRDGHPDFLVTADSWPAFLYPHAKADANDMEHGLFQSAILVKV